MISIIIPIKNEPYIQVLVDKIHKILSRISHEIIVVDKSRYIKKIKNVKQITQKSDGLGNAILEGLEHSKGEYIITMDGDGSHRPEDLPKFLHEINYYDIIVGSRYVKGGYVDEKLFRIMISKAYCTLASFLFDLSIKDNMSGFVASKREVYKKIKPKPLGFKINTELLFKAKKFSFKTVEIPIRFIRRKSGKQKSGISEGIRTLFYLIILRFGLR